MKFYQNSTIITIVKRATFCKQGTRSPCYHRAPQAYELMCCTNVVLLLLLLLLLLHNI